MSAKTRQIVKEAERLLSLHNYDAAHDLAHHKAVYATALDISKHVTEKFDPNVLEIACMWHDVVVGKNDADEHKEVTHNTATHLRQYMLDQGFSARDAETAYLAVRHHEFDDKPVN